MPSCDFCEASNFFEAPSSHFMGLQTFWKPHQHSGWPGPERAPELFKSLRLWVSRGFEADAGVSKTHSLENLMDLNACEIMPECITFAIRFNPKTGSPHEF
jgi:hypothetical protein